MKNHLVPDEYSSQVVKEIFYMYVNKGMSTIKIADELNKKKIEPPSMYLKIPTYMKRQSVNPNGKYVWLRAQIGKILRNEVYLGNVVGRKFQKVSHKIAKVRCTKKEEHIVLENMHEAIIDKEIWEKAQEKLNSYTKTRERKNEHYLKGIIYCGECGNKATIRCREEKRKSGKVWKATYFICSKRNNYTGLCECKQISASLIEEILHRNLKKEIEKVNFSESELNQIYQESKMQSKSKNNLMKAKLKDLKNKLEEKEKNISELYQDKLNKIIQIEDFKIIYEKMKKQRDTILREINSIKIQEEVKEKHEEIKRIEEEILSIKIFDKSILEKLVKRVEFNKEKDIKISFYFSKRTSEK